MPQIETWSRLPSAVRDHLVDRMRDRNITIDDLNKLRLWIESKPNVPEGNWYKDFGSFKLCGEGKYPKTFLLRANQHPGQSFKFARRRAGIYRDPSGPDHTKRRDILIRSSCVRAFWPSSRFP